MTILGLDIGSSSVKAALLRDGKIVGRLARASFSTQFDGVRAEVDPLAILRAIASALGDLGTAARRAEAIGLSVMAPAWIAMDRRGKPLTPIVTHQDRRSAQVAADLERRVGEEHYLKIAGNRPFPGGISCSTAAWFAKQHPEVLRKADLIGHLNTFLHRQITGQRVIDPSNASFTGLYETLKLGGWNPSLCNAAGIARSKLPEILESDQIGGKITPSAARNFGLLAGTPVMAGWIDTTGAVVLAGSKPGCLLNVSGSTDVLALCTNHPRPHPELLTRAIGVGRHWLSVGTISAAGSALDWTRRQLFADLTEENFYRLVRKLSRQTKTDCKFEPYLAGERTSMEQKRAAFENLTLATTREEMLAAVIDALAQSSARRLHLLKTRGVKISHQVITSGGTARTLRQVLQRDWPGHWTFHYEDEASLRGLSLLTPRSCP